MIAEVKIAWVSNDRGMILGLVIFHLTL